TGCVLRSSWSSLTDNEPRPAALFKNVPAVSSKASSRRTSSARAASPALLEPESRREPPVRARRQPRAARPRASSVWASPQPPPLRSDYLLAHSPTDSQVGILVRAPVPASPLSSPAAS